MIILTSRDTWEIRTWRQPLVLGVAAGIKRLEGSDVSVLRAKLSRSDDFSTKRREGSDERGRSTEPNASVLIFLDLNCFLRPHAEIPLVFFEPLGLNGAFSGISQGTGEGRMEQTSMAGLIILLPLT